MALNLKPSVAQTAAYSYFISSEFARNKENLMGVHSMNEKIRIPQYRRKVMQILLYMIKNIHKIMYPIFFTFPFSVFLSTGDSVVVTDSDV